MCRFSKSKFSKDLDINIFLVNIFFVRKSKILNEVNGGRVFRLKIHSCNDFSKIKITIYNKIPKKKLIINTIIRKIKTIIVKRYINVIL